VSTRAWALLAAMGSGCGALMVIPLTLWESTNLPQRQDCGDQLNMLRKNRQKPINSKLLSRRCYCCREAAG